MRNLSKEQKWRGVSGIFPIREGEEEIVGFDGERTQIQRSKSRCDATRMAKVPRRRESFGGCVLVNMCTFSLLFLINNVLSSSSLFF